ncbi:Epidermal growth factor-like protein 7 [Galemys pyrenaicus]|uniref:Epidermal growth factor-like protein 7 n=1 Tax=Galemys pyrenaicus TaxID=202257 RepID=A0A8J6DS03_GALPY|nr:Epidermal growth factor-like protein 7 [Galemys pyrenaicus]
MRGSRGLLLLWCLALAAGGTGHVHRPGVCAARPPRPESFVQRVYQPFLTTCDGQRACSSYRTLYRTAYRRSPWLALPGPRFACCPGWRRAGGAPGACVAEPPPQLYASRRARMGGAVSGQAAATAPRDGRAPSAKQTGRRGQDGTSAGDRALLLLVRAVTLQTRTPAPPEASAQLAGAGDRATSGPRWALCPAGAEAGPAWGRGWPWGRTGLPHTSLVSPGVDSRVEEEMQRLRSRVDVLEQHVPASLCPQQLQLALGPLHGLAEPGRLLAHSLQQLDRIDSLSEQISFLEEQLGSCEPPARPGGGGRLLRGAGTVRLTSAPPQAPARRICDGVTSLLTRPVPPAAPDPGAHLPPRRQPHTWRLGACRAGPREATMPTGVWARLPVSE